MSDVTTDDAIGQALKSHLRVEEWQWLLAQTQKLSADPQSAAIARIFALLPRQLKSVNQGYVSLDKAYVGPNGLSLFVQDWPVVRLARVWTMVAIPKMMKADYVQAIERLFKYGDMEELTALYAALPVYHYPEVWAARCQEGIRSNMGPVRHAVMVRNPYPARFLDEGAWNQLVLKAFFTEEDIPNIVGLKPRNNPCLARALTDYAYERYAAKRVIHPMLWILVGPFMDERAYDLMKRVISESQVPLEQQAIAYAFAHSNYDKAHKYIAQHKPSMVLSDDISGIPWEAWEQ